jgi:enterochelin esterase-like enzyme
MKRIGSRILIATLAIMTVGQLAAQDRPTVKEIKNALEKKQKPEETEKLATRLRDWFGADNLKKGPNPKVEKMDTLWAIEAPAPPMLVLRVEETEQKVPMVRLGETNVYALADTMKEGVAFTWAYEVNGSRMGGGQMEAYKENPDNLPQPNVPKGKVTQQPNWKSKIFDGTDREWWVYVPAQVKADTPACVMVFQDGQGPKDYAPTVFDNLIAKGDMPVTVGVFISPGKFANGRSNRSFEYDTLSDQYVRFLLEEILPEVEKTVKLRQDAAGRAIAGISSGGICAFTAAWERPDAFSKVLSWVGSFTGIAARLTDGKLTQPGGNNYPVLIRKTPMKPIRVFLQDGMNDLNNEHGSWPLANMEMEKALAYKKYDYKFVMGQGFHSDRHGRAILPESLRWLWRDHKEK